MWELGFMRRCHLKSLLQNNKSIRWVFNTWELRLHKVGFTQRDIDIKQIIHNKFDI